MTMTVTITTEPEFLRAVVGGDFALADAKSNFAEILEAVGQHGSRKVLFDARNVVGEPTTAQRFEYGVFVAQASAALERRLAFKPKFAYVMQLPVLDQRRLGEITAVNRGMHVRAFDNLDDALRWLGVS